MLLAQRSGSPAHSGTPPTLAHLPLRRRTIALYYTSIPQARALLASPPLQARMEAPAQERTIWSTVLSSALMHAAQNLMLSEPLLVRWIILTLGFGRAGSCSGRTRTITLSSRLRVIMVY